jgi:hypothetical protein
MSRKPNLRVVARSAEREQLASAIARRQASDQADYRTFELAEKNDEVQAAMLEHEAAERELADAERVSAQVTPVRRYSARIIDLKSKPDESLLEAARVRAAVAAKRLREARESAERERRFQGVEPREAEQSVKRAALAVLLSETDVGREVQQARELQAELVARRVRLRAILSADTGANVLNVNEKTAINVLLHDRDLPATYGFAEHVDWNAHAASVRVREAIERLSADADSPL